MQNTFRSSDVIILLAITAIVLFAWWAMDDPSSSLVSGLVLLWVVGITLSLRIAQWRYRVPVKRMTPAQMVAGFAGTMVFVWGSTAIVWKWPDTSPWILNSALALFIVWARFVGLQSEPKGQPSCLKELLCR